MSMVSGIVCPRCDSFLESYNALYSSKAHGNSRPSTKSEAPSQPYSMEVLGLVVVLFVVLALIGTGLLIVAHFKH